MQSVQTAGGERRAAKEQRVPHQWAGIFLGDIDVIPSSAPVGYLRDSPCATMGEELWLEGVAVSILVPRESESSRPAS